jgi:hypothetical protein
MKLFLRHEAAAIGVRETAVALNPHPRSASKLDNAVDASRKNRKLCHP